MRENDMSRAIGQPVLARANTPSRILEPIRLGKGTGFDEDWLQRILFDHPEALPIADIEPGFAPLVAVAREVPSGVPLDLPETWRHRSPQRHRGPLGLYSIPIARRPGRGSVQPVFSSPSRASTSCPSPTRHRDAKLKTLCTVGSSLHWHD